MLLAVPALFGVLFSVFLLMRAVPDDVVTGLVGLQGTVVQGAVLLIAAAFITVNLFVDVIYAFIDPRIRYA